MSSTQKTAVVIGATGLVGTEIVRQLLSDDRYEMVKIFHRRSTNIDHPNLQEYIINFHEMRIWKHLITGDELYSALGTTLKTAGSKAAQFEVDFDFQLDIAKHAFENGIQKYALVSSLGATEATKNFYLNMKGKLDREVRNIGFKKLVILRPSLLTGGRKEKRIGEVLSEPVLKAITRIPGLKKYTPIKARDVAEAMINVMNSDSGKETYEGDEIFELIN